MQLMAHGRSGTQDPGMGSARKLHHHSGLLLPRITQLLHLPYRGGCYGVISVPEKLNLVCELRALHVQRS